MHGQQVDLKKAKNFIFNLFKRDASPEATDWLCGKVKKINQSGLTKDLYLAFSAAPRYIKKGLLRVSDSDLEKAEILRRGFNISKWTLVQTARTLLLLTMPHQNREEYLNSVEQLFSTAEMGELGTLYASLPLLPYPEAHKLRAAEGIRTNMGTVFEAIALENPYPSEYLEEGAWNQMVLKTVFVGKPLYRIYGLDKRSNPTLARILSDYAHERWAAGRTVTPELWRPVGPFLNESLIEDIKKLFTHPDPTQQEAAALACAQSNFIPARAMLEQHQALQLKIESGELNWNSIGEKSITQN